MSHPHSTPADSTHADLTYAEPTHKDTRSTHDASTRTTPVHHAAGKAALENAMTPYQTLQQQTAEQRQWLLDTPVIRRALTGDIDRATYQAFLTQAYHHVKYTVPLMMACGARLPERLEWLRGALVEYIEEEYGHQAWILDDIRALGGDADAVAAGRPAPATELMVSYVRDVIEHGNPIGFFGMVQVLEGTSTAIATQAAEKMRDGAGLPADAFRYLESHGSLDIGHLAFFEAQINRIESAQDLQAVIDTANMVYRLYGAMFRTLGQAAGDAHTSEVLADALV